jgi:hypothetical protein
MIRKFTLVLCLLVLSSASGDVPALEVPDQQRGDQAKQQIDGSTGTAPSKMGL